MELNAQNTPQGLSRRLLLQTGALGALSLSAGLLSACTPSGTPTSGGAGGGNLRVAVLGGGSAETLFPGKLQAASDFARAYQVYEPLFRLEEGEGTIGVLAEEMTANADGSMWTLRLREGVVWHDGKKFTADDVIYTIQYHEKEKTEVSELYGNVDIANLRKVDDLTVSMPLKTPNFLFHESLADVDGLIFQNGTTNFDSPIGTGPFKFKSFQVGQRATYVKNPDYWGGAPKLDSLEILSIDDDQARINALQSGQVDVITSVPFSSVKTLESARMSVLSSSSGSWVAVRMRQVDGPFNVPEVRQALRLLVDREQVLNNGLQGHGRIGNDLFGWFDPNYAPDLPQRTYDPDQAKSLLKKAGYENLDLKIPTTQQAPGTNSFITLFAASAKAGGVNIQVEQQSTAQFYSVPYDQKPWGPTYWNARTVSAQMASSLIPGSFNETAWDNSEFSKAYYAATAASDPQKQKQFLVDAQHILHAQGTYLIPYFYDLIDASTSRVQGLQKGVRMPLGDYNFSKATVQ